MVKVTEGLSGWGGGVEVNTGYCCQQVTRVSRFIKPHGRAANDPNWTCHESGAEYLGIVRQ